MSTNAQDNPRCSWMSWMSINAPNDPLCSWMSWMSKLTLGAAGCLGCLLMTLDVRVFFFFIGFLFLQTNHHNHYKLFHDTNKHQSSGG